MFYCYQGTDKELGISGNTGTIPRFRSNQIKEQHETMKLQYEEIMLKNTKNLIN